MKLTRPHIVILLFAVIVTLGLVGIILLDRSSEVSLTTLQSAPDLIAIDDRKYKLETILWRNFGLIFPPENSLLIAVVKVVPYYSFPSNLAFPSNLDADHLWIVNGKEVWSTSFSDETHPEVKFRLEKVARNGPKWDTGIQVDVIVRLVHDHQNTYLLRAPNQTILKIA